MAELPGRRRGPRSEPIHPADPADPEVRQPTGGRGLGRFGQVDATLAIAEPGTAVDTGELGRIGDDDGVRARPRLGPPRLDQQTVDGVEDERSIEQVCGFRDGQAQTGARSLVAGHRDDAQVAVGIGEGEIVAHLLGLVPDGDHEPGCCRVEIDDVGDRRLAVDRDQRLGKGIGERPQPRPGACGGHEHGADGVHAAGTAVTPHRDLPTRPP
jgi:hypothetical protein